MKIKDVKHDHSLTDLLKVSIFSLLMLAPMINVGVRSAYVICNKNAYQSYSGAYETNQKEYINDYNDLVIDETYHLTTRSLGVVSETTTDFILQVDELVNITDNTPINNGNYIRFVFQSNGLNQLQIRGTENGTNLYSYTLESSILTFDFQYKGIVRNPNNYTLINNVIYTITYVGNTLDNVFEYSVNQLTESPLYNWVENTAIYSSVALMNTQLGITQPVISLLVVYWLLLTVIYIIIDIVIRVFTWLTHMIGSKTA